MDYDPPDDIFEEQNTDDMDFARRRDDEKGKN